MLVTLNIGLAAVVFMLGVISLQLGTLKRIGILVDLALVAIFLTCIGISGLLVLQAVTTMQV